MNILAANESVKYISEQEKRRDSKWQEQNKCY